MKRLLSLLKTPGYAVTASLIAFGFFCGSLYILQTLPGTNGYQCIEGANFTASNIIFSSILSMLIGLVFTGIIAMHVKKLPKIKKKATGLSVFGLSLGVLSTFCTLCALPGLSFLGLGVGLSMLSNHSFAMKVISIILLLGSAILVDKQLKEECMVCNLAARIKTKDEPPAAKPKPQKTKKSSSSSKKTKK